MANPEKQVYPTMNHFYRPKIFISYSTEVHMKRSHISAPQESANGQSMWLSDDVAAVTATIQGVLYEGWCINGMSASVPMGSIFNNLYSFT